MTPIKKLENLVNRYTDNINYYQSEKYNETQLRMDFLDPLFSILGWDITNSSGKPTGEREVLVEEGLKVSARENTKKPDYTFRFYSERKFFVEAKKPSVCIDSSSEPAKQLRRYGFTAKLKISVLSNFEYLAIYDCSTPVQAEDDATHSRVRLYHYTEFVKYFEELNQLIGRNSVYSGNFDIEWEHIEDKIELLSVDTLFLDQINKWRVLLAEEFIKIKPDLDDIELNDLTQSYINSIVFLRVCEDRDLEKYETLYQLAIQKDYLALIDNLKKSDKKYNSGLFNLTYIDELIINSNSSIWLIIEQLYFPQSIYSFSVFSSDILGNIYEIFLSKKVHITKDFKIVLSPKEDHIDRDVVTTPIFIVNEIIRNTIAEFCNGKTDKDILNSKFADIACGSGVFLIELFQSVQDILVDYYIEHDRSKLHKIAENSYRLKFIAKKEILIRCIHGVDKDLNAVKACSFGLLLKLLEGETDSTIGKHFPVLPSLENNILFGNSLIDSIEDDNHLNEINPLSFSDKFDVIVGNPPYMATEHIKSITPLEYPIYRDLYKSADKQFDKYYLFIERSIALLKPDGYLGYILPSKFMKVASAYNLRTLLLKSKSLYKIISFGAQQIFKNKSTYTCLLFLKNSQQSQFYFCDVEDIHRWLIDKNNSKYSGIYNSNNLTNEAWNLNSEVDQIIERMFLKSQPLGEILGLDAIANGIQTSANSVYIHKVIDQDDQYVSFKYKDCTYQVEKILTRPFFETPRSQKEALYTYKDVEPNAIVIYPYQKIGDRVLLVEYDDLKKNYPQMFNFLQVIKEPLSKSKRSIQPKPLTENEWYRYGRSQALKNCDVPEKIIVGVLSNGYKYSIDRFQTFVSSGGTAGYSIINIPEGNPYSIYYIQAILSSKYLEWFASIYGEIFRGGYIARGTKIQIKMPIPIIDFNNKDECKKHNKIAELQESMNKTYSHISKADERSKITLTRKFESMSVELQLLIAELYNLGDLDKKIPSIEEIYRID